jgi:hypothetical protein
LFIQTQIRDKSNSKVLSNSSPFVTEWDLARRIGGLKHGGPAGRLFRHRSSHAMYHLKGRAEWDAAVYKRNQHSAKLQAFTELYAFTHVS